jgi:hypothetical protein
MYHVMNFFEHLVTARNFQRQVVNGVRKQSAMFDRDCQGILFVNNILIMRIVILKFWKEL